ncbi:MAG: Gfo/Idh/MocA family oxidoreductase [Pirellulales bacterium]
MSESSHPHRRHFLQGAALGVATATVTGTTLATAAGANQRVRVALIGCGGRGKYLADIFTMRDDVELAYVADCHQERLAMAAKQFPRAKAVGDYSTVLDDPTVDAVILATPVHWHAPGTIVACEAGKHVYVEKPCSHNVREGRLLVKAAQRYKRVVQHGTQVRSTSTIQAGIQLLRDGIIGEVLQAKAWNIQRRPGVGRGKRTKPPEALDYDKWLGPVPDVPYRDTFMSGWNWQTEFGTGEIGNDGIHDLDYACWGLGVETHPTHISAAGGRYLFHNGSPFPDTQQVCFEYAPGTSGSPKMLIYEQRLWSTNYPYNCDSGAEYFGTKGRMFLSRRGKLEVWLERNERHKVDVPLEAQNTETHVEDFIDAIRNDRRANAHAEIAHRTASVCHLGNIATKLRRTLQFDPDQEQFIDDDEANGMVGRPYRAHHWATPQHT